jgi:hypothetical protein
MDYPPSDRLLDRLTDRLLKRERREREGDVLNKEKQGPCVWVKCVEGLYYKRTIQCLASSEILTLPPPHRPASVYPTAFGAGRGHTRWVERGWGVNSSEDARHCSVLYICKYFVVKCVRVPSCSPVSIVGPWLALLCKCAPYPCYTSRVTNAKSSYLVTSQHLFLLV